MAYSINAKSRKRVIIGFVVAILAVVLSGVALTISPDIGLFIILAISITLIIVGVRGIAIGTRPSKWPSVEATVLDIKEDWIDEIMHSYAAKYIYPKIQYQFAFQGVEHLSDTVGFQVENIWVPEYDSWGIKTDEETRFWHKWKVGEKITAYVNPKNPAESVIINKIGRKYRLQQLALIAGGVLIGVIWLILNSM